MPGYRSEPTRPEKAKAIAGVIAVYALVIGAALLMPADSPLGLVERHPTVVIDVNLLPEPQPPPENEPGKAEEEEGSAGKKAEQTEVVAPVPKIKVRSRSRVAAARVPGTGSTSTSGAAAEGTGPGAGGSGTGPGGGGSGGGGGSPPQWIAGELRNMDYPPAALRSGLQGRVSVRFTVLTNGRIANCRIMRSSGSPLLDSTTCRLLTRRLRFRPATNSAGVPIQSELGSDYTWGINFHRY